MLAKTTKTGGLILKNLFFGDLTASELSKKIEKSLPTTQVQINQLIEDGLVVEKGVADSTGGRRPQLYAIQPKRLYIVSVAMDQFITRIALVNAAGKIEGDIVKHNLTLPNNANSSAELVSHIKNFIDKNSEKQDYIVGVGIGMPGFIDVRRGINHSFLPSPNKSLTEYLTDSIGLPVVIENDSSLAAMAELRWGKAKGKKEVSVINVGWGVGLGVILGAKLYRGANGFAGEFSHIPLFDNNKICSCGKHGCLETETSMMVIVTKAIEEIEKGKPTLLKNLDIDKLEESFLEIIHAIERGDKLSIELLSKSAYNIGRGVAILIHLLNPELVIISGIGAAAGKAWVAPIQQAINEHSIPKIAENVGIEVSQLGYKAELLGAAAIVMENFEYNFTNKNILLQ